MGRRSMNYRPVDPALAARADRQVSYQEQRQLTLRLSTIAQGFARRQDGGSRKALRCTPSKAELTGERPRLSPAGNDNKLIYDTREIAEECARALRAAGGIPMRAMSCGRHRPGHEGHWHLTTDGRHARRLKARQRALRIPPPRRPA